MTRQNIHEPGLFEELNRDCFCIAVDGQSLHESLGAHLADSCLPDRLMELPGKLFADAPVFLSEGHVREMTELIGAVEDVTRNPAYRDAVLSRVPGAPVQDHGPKGVFFSYDFHLGESGPQLIEINTNAGGALLNLYLTAAQRACCQEVEALIAGGPTFADAEHRILSMFEEEWRLQRPGERLRSVAIIDRAPSEQFLYPEFLLFKALFDRHGIETVIADPEELSLSGGVLWRGETRIDLVYNRLTDFYLESAESRVLAQAWADGAAVVTPSPFNYALHADKHNLSLLADSNRLMAFGVADETLAIVQRSLPMTVTVTEQNADCLWRDRKRLFFKPATGYGSRGAYRGAKVTRRVWADICKADYIAQAIVPPSERRLNLNGEPSSFKVDIRCITYAGRLAQLSARLYQGQTTNMRTEGGGLATVFPVSHP